jgi:uroporphyrinogen III methyltransferase/synthase
MSEGIAEPEKAALSGVGVLVTRDARQSTDLTAQLRALGASVIEFPVIEIAAPASSADLDRALFNLASYDWVVFASTNAVDSFANRIVSLGIPSNTLTHCSLGAVGAKTAERARSYGLEIDFCPENFSAVDFVREFCQVHEPGGKKFLWPRTNVGNLTIKDLLEEHGASVDAVVAYETVLPQQSLERRAELAQIVKRRQVDVITLTSSQAAKNLHYLLGELANDKPSLDNLSIASIGSQTHSAVEQLFSCVCFRSEDSTIEALVEAIVKHHKSSKA